MTPDDFIAMLAQPARATQAATGIPASFMVAHAAVESDWFNCVPALEGCNLFGMTAGSSWRGATLTIPIGKYLKVCRPLSRRSFANTRT